jgi:tetratricopeptide (TPR) repeat protein
MSETQVLIKEMATGLMAAEATPRPPGGSRSEALSEISPEAREFSRRGCRLRASGRLEEAAAFHREAIALSPRFAEAHNNLGNCLRELKLLNQAVESYYRAVRRAHGGRCRCRPSGRYFLASDW